MYLRFSFKWKFENRILKIIENVDIKLDFFFLNSIKMYFYFSDMIGYKECKLIKWNFRVNWVIKGENLK